MDEEMNIILNIASTMYAFGTLLEVQKMIDEKGIEETAQTIIFLENRVGCPFISKFLDIA